MTKPTVSVVMITYGHQDFILEAISSILMQKCDFNIELIISNDNSPDNTDIIVKNYLSTNKVPRNIHVKYVKHEINKTAFPNFIWVLNEAEGKYVAICEGDDYWIDPLKLQKQVALMEMYDHASMCVALNTQYDIESGKKKIDTLYKGANYPLIYFDNLNAYFHTSTFLIRKTILSHILNKYTHLILGDTPLRFLLINEGPFVVLNDVVSVYRITGTGIWSSIDNYTRDLQHYNIYNKLRTLHVKKRRQFYAKREIMFLMRLIEAELDRKNYKVAILQIAEITKLTLLYDQLHLPKYFYNKVKSRLSPSIQKKRNLKRR